MRNKKWQDDYWLLLMQLYLRKPVGMKPLYCRDMVQLSQELHIAPRRLYARMQSIARLETPRIERIWHEYSRNPERLARAAQLLRSMVGFNSGGEFYEGVEVEETFERDFRPLQAEQRLTPAALVMVLNLYFQLTPLTMVSETPEVQDMAKTLDVPASLVADVLDAYQHCDPYLKRSSVQPSPLMPACRQVWQHYWQWDSQKLSDYAGELAAYYQ